MSNKPKRHPSSAQKVAAARAGSGTPVWIWIVGFVVLVGAGALAVVLTSGGGGTTINDAGEEVEAIVYGEPTVEGTPLPELPQTGPDPAVGLPAPAIEGQDLAGDPTTIPSGPGSRIVTFLAHWCPHCQEEVPRLTAWLAENGRPEGVDLYSVATGTAEDRPNFPPGDWLAREDWPVEVLVDDADGTAAQAYGLTGFPFFVVIGPDGDVVQRTSGELTEAQFEGLLEAARTGQPTGSSPGGPSSGAG